MSTPNAPGVRHEDDPQSERTQLFASLSEEIRRHNAGTTLFLQAVADRLDMNITDLQCLNILEIEGPATAGRLAELTGLSTGAVTRLVDRLEQSGYVRRVRGRQDRRQVIIEPVAEMAREKVGPLFGGMAFAWFDLLSDYSNEQLESLLLLFQRVYPLMQAEIAKLR